MNVVVSQPTYLLYLQRYPYKRSRVVDTPDIFEADGPRARGKQIDTYTRNGSWRVYEYILLQL